MKEEEEKKDAVPEIPAEPAGKPAEKKQLSELDAARQEAEEYKDKYLRALAEQNNINKRAEKDREEFVKYAASVVISKLLPVLDSFEMALKTEPEHADKKFLHGMKMIYNNLLELLKKEGLEREKTAGQKMDPLKHEVVSTVETEKEKEDGSIVEELRAGYSFKGTVLRPAMVKIAKKKGG
jgi:molecular chaperone GrpE